MLLDDDKMVVSRDVTFAAGPAQTTESTNFLDLSYSFDEVSITSEDSDAFEEDPEQAADRRGTTQEATTQEPTTQKTATRGATRDSSNVPQGNQ